MADVPSSRNSYVSSRRTSTGISKAALYRWLSWLVPALALVLWELAARIGLISPQVLPAPSNVAETALDLARNGDLFVHLGVSLLRAAAGFVIAARSASYSASQSGSRRSHWRYSTVQSRWFARFLSSPCCRSSSSGSAWARLRRFSWWRWRSCSPFISTPCSASARSIQS